MINTVEKIYTETGFSYKVIYQDGTEWSVPHSEGNRHYQAIMEYIENGGTVIDNGGNE